MGGVHAQVELSSEEGSLFWIRYMRFLRRNDKAAASRKVFLRARKWPQCGWQVRFASLSPFSGCCTFQGGHASTYCPLHLCCMCPHGRPCGAQRQAANMAKVVDLPSSEH